MIDRLRSSFALRLVSLSFILVAACMFFDFLAMTAQDGVCYRHIVDFGFSSKLNPDPTVADRGNVGFFPGYPLACYLVKKILGLGTDAFPTTGALILTSNGFAVLLWVYLEKLLSLFGDQFSRAKMLMLALYPYCFFFYCSYTESMFISMMIGFIYFSERWLREEDEKKSWRLFWLAVIHGFLMNFTRLVGFVIVLYPVIRAYQTGEKKLRALLIAAFSLTSIGLFLAYCQVKFGAWDFYFISEKNVWNTYVDFSKLLPPTELFNFSRPVHADTVSKYVAIGLGVFLSVKLIQLIKEKLWLTPYFAMILCSGMLWGEYLLGRSSWNFSGLGRYLIPVFALILPFLKIEPKFNWKWVTIGVVLLGFQIAYALKFGRHGWVA